jgi:hypothetical protein
MKRVVTTDHRLRRICCATQCYATADRSFLGSGFAHLQARQRSAWTHDLPLASRDRAEHARRSPSIALAWPSIAPVWMAVGIRVNLAERKNMARYLPLGLADLAVTSETIALIR